MYARNTAIVLAAAGLAVAQSPVHTPSTMATMAVPTNGTVMTTTRVVTAYTTYCPGPTTFDFNGHHYVVDKATTITITDCPCTIVEPVHTHPAKPCYGEWCPPAHGGNGEKPCKGENCPPGHGGNGEKPCKGENCPPGQGGNNGGNGEKPCTGESCPPAVTPVHPGGGIVTAGAGAAGISLMAAMVGLLAL